jgi:hypothetical protein
MPAGGHVPADHQAQPRPLTPALGQTRARVIAGVMQPRQRTRATRLFPLGVRIRRRGKQEADLLARLLAVDQEEPVGTVACEPFELRLSAAPRIRPTRLHHLQRHVHTATIPPAVGRVGRLDVAGYCRSSHAESQVTEQRGAEGGARSPPARDVSFLGVARQ